MELLSKETAAFMRELPLWHKRCFEIGEALLRECERRGVPEEALDYLIGPEGGEAMETITLLIEAEHAASSGERAEKRQAWPQRGIVVVPDMCAVEITALARQRRQFADVDPDYQEWDYFVGPGGQPISGRGGRFEVFMWDPVPEVSSEEVRAHFKAKKAYGNVAAFTAWIAQNSLAGCYASIPEEGIYSRNGYCVPVSARTEKQSRLTRRWLGGGWRKGGCIFVAFREL